MKIQVVSDLHLEMKPYSFFTNPQADVVALVGDIVALGYKCAKLYQLETLIKHIDKPIVYVTGNHEYYGFGRVPDTNAIIKTLEKKYPNFHFLDNESVIIDDVEFIGSTLWSNFDLVPNMSQAWFANAVENAIYDFSTILSTNGKYGDRRDGRLTGQEMIEMNVQARKFIDGAVRVQNGLKKVVVTHFVPSANSIHEKYKGNALNPYFVCNCEQLMPGVKLWLHGHTHSSFDYVLKIKHPSVDHELVNTRIVCNPRGYDKENKGDFDSQKIVEI
jgi:predicted phosphodiesterase